MKPESAAEMQHSRRQLAEAIKIADVGIPSVAGRQAYLAALSAGRALAFELRNKGPKTHKGVKVVLHEIVKDGAAIDAKLLSIFDEGFDLKVAADYGDPGEITDDDCRRIVDMAAKLIAQIEAILAKEP